MTLTNLIDAAKADAQSAAVLQAKVAALLAGHKAQTFTPLPPEPEPEHYHYLHEPGHDTRDLLTKIFSMRVPAREE